ncbi:conserved Plasmodium protein, unknown function [Plasmodium gallinaceum]|uniref:Uncharacterized protein n=1 Tax=Plasmodium gallinaceum TaxID=5849 RepID=A0A1J1GMV2_PLAGA|nr:conserved Plasmodium protein, unknown function [Plasmodium gallinaceum]CRG93766.1 conserved Plasmodium protein, unknown function [Plasmodium gallinaceum]
MLIYRLTVNSNNSNYFINKRNFYSQKYYSFLRKLITKKHFNNFQFIYKRCNNSHQNISEHTNEKIFSNKDNVDNNINLFNDNLVITNKLNSNKVFSLYTKTYIYKESEQILILSLKKLNEYEKIKENVKISVFIYELQNLSKSKISFNVLKKIEIINNLFKHINDNIGNASPSLLLSVCISYKNINLNKYTYFKNILQVVCNHIKVSKSNKLNKLLKNENEKEDYKYTIELLNKKKKNKKKINMLNVYTNNLNNSALCYILYSYSSLFTISNSYLLYICKYILLNICNINYYDMLSLLYFLNRTSVKIKKSDISYYKDIELNKLKEKNNNDLENNNNNNNENNLDNDEDKKLLNLESNNKNKLVINKITDLKNNKNKHDEYKNTYMKILRTIIYIINKKKTFFENPNILILILYYYFKMNLIPIQIFYKLHYKIKKNIKNIEVKYISLYLYILSNIKFSITYYKFIYKYLTNIFKENIKKFNILSLSLSFYTLSKNQYYNEDFIRSCINLFQINTESLNDINITNIIYTLGKLKIRDDILCNKLCDLIIQRIDNISAINLGLIVHNLSKINYKNERFYNICLNKAKELLYSFTLKQLVIFAEGMVINNIYDYEFFYMFFNQLIKLDNNNNNQKKKNILNKICFSLVLEKPDFIKRFPLSIKTVISKNIDYIQNKNFSDIHDEIINILNYLNIENFEILKKKEPYVFDIFIKNNHNIYIDIISSMKFLKNNNNLNGFIELKKRHMELLNIKYYYFNKSCYLSLDSLDKKVNFIKNFLKNKCSLDFNYVNKSKEQKKSEIKNLISFNENQKNYIRNINNRVEIDDKKYSPNKYSIKNKDFYVFPSCVKTENIVKKFHKSKINKVNYQEPLIKKQQIYIDCDDDILLNEKKINLLKNSLLELPKIKETKNKYFQLNEDKYLFEKKCHGLSKREYFDEKTNKIIIKKSI